MFHFTICYHLQEEALDVQKEKAAPCTCILRTFMVVMELSELRYALYPGELLIRPYQIHDTSDAGLSFRNSHKHMILLQQFLKCYSVVIMPAIMLWYH